MANAHLPRALTAWLVEHHGVTTTAVLRQFGVGRKAQDRLVDSGILRQIHRGAYALTTATATLEHRCRVLCCAHPDGFVTGPTAGMLGGLRRQSPAELQFATLHGRRIDPMTGVRFRQTTVIGPLDRLVRADGIVVASWARLAFDLADDLRQLDHRSVVHQLLDRRLVTGNELIAIGHRLCHPARKGSTTFRQTLHDVLGIAPHDSHPEVELADALARRGVPVVPQVPVRRAADGVTFHIDLGVPAARWGIELDIHPEHRSVEGHHRDAGRVRSLHHSDWQIEPVTELDLDDLPSLADELARLYRERAVTIGGLAVHPGGPSGLGRASGLG